MENEKQLTELGKAVADLEEDKAYGILDRYLADNIPPLEIIDALSKGMEEVGRKYKDGEYYLSELVFSGEIFKNAMSKLKPLIEASGGRESAGKLIVGTVKGDIHDLGKNIVITLLECAGYEVVDLGVDVPAEDFVKALKESEVGLVGLSALLTTAFDSMRNTVAAIKDAGFGDEVKVMIGGGSTSEKLKKQIGADFYGRDATEAVDIAKSAIK